MDEASTGTPASQARPGGDARARARVGRYELVLRMSEDGAGSVWLAREKIPTGAERIVRLRIVSPTLAADERFRDILRQEVKLASGLSHPSVAQVLEFQREDDGTLIVVSEWVEGESLAELRAATGAKKVAIPPGVVLRILADACAGLHAAHLLRDRNGGLLNVVHGDLSPKSILVGTNGAARVLDLGFMKAVARHAGRANVAWSSEAGSHGQRIDRHADVWGVGSILAQALAPASPASPAPLTPPLLAELVARARSNDPIQRFATAAEMQGAIEAAMMTLGLPTTRGAVAALLKEHLGDRVSARAGELEGARGRSPSVLSVPTPAVDSVPATAQSVRPDEVRFVNHTLPLVDTGSATSTTPVPRPPERGVAARSSRKRTGIFVAAGVVVLGAGASATLALRPHSRVAAAPPVAPAPPRRETPVVHACPGGMVEIAATTERAPPLDAFCIDAAPVTTEAYKACSDAGDCKRAATENRWPGITATEQAADDLLCRERDPRAHAKEPMNCVDRDMARIYCEAHGARLPSEAEAAFVARADGAGAFSEWSLRPQEPPTSRSYAIGFRCARSL
jgi:serine/threonine protein kinase